MIKAISGKGSVEVSGGYVTFPYFNMNPHNPLSGAIRYNPNTSSIEIFDGSNWISNSSVPMIGLTPEVEKIIDWARIKMQQEKQLLDLAANYPAIKDLKEKLDVMMVLLKDETKV
jgi:hypothetical protein